MKLMYVIGFLCITVILVTALGMGYNGALASGGVGAIVAVLTWQGRKQVDKKGNNIEAVVAALTKLGYKDRSVKRIASKMKGGKA